MATHVSTASKGHKQIHFNVGIYIPTALEGGDPKNVTYILKMVKMQVLEILQLPPPPARTGPI